MRLVVNYLVLAMALIMVGTRGLSSPVFASNKTAKIYFSPSAAGLNTGQIVELSLYVDGGGQQFNAASATVTLPTGVAVESIKPGNCNMSYLQAPTTSNPSFAGAIFGASFKNCLVYSIDLIARTSGTKQITLSNASVRSSDDATEILASVAGITLTIGGSTKLAPLPSSRVSYQLSVKVVDVNGTPIPNVKVTLFCSVPGGSPAGTTSAQGLVSFSNLSNGVCSVEVDYQNHPVTREISLEGSNPNLSMEVKLDTTSTSSSALSSPASVLSFKKGVGIVLAGLIAVVVLAIIVTIVKSSKRRYRI